jgi:hypothetical protein
MKSPSRLAWLFCSVSIVLVSFWYYPKWKNTQTEAVISWDASGYYMYLPAIFVYHDLKELKFRDYVVTTYQPAPGFDQAFLHPESGHYVMKYSSGLALQELPFFLVAHLLASPLGYPADGFSIPYQLALQIANTLVALLALWLVRRALLPRFGEWPTVLTLLVLVLGTNYLDYSAINGAMTHNWLFLWYAVLMLLTPAFYRRPTLGKAIAIGAVIGLMTLTRPTELLAVLIPVFWGMRPNWASVRERLTFWQSHLGHLVGASIVGAAFISIQPLYWHYVSGHWIVYSYQDQGFSWLKPHLWDGIFSFRSGWLLYSPLLITALLGFGTLRRQEPLGFWAILLFAAAFIYVTFAWDIWWYGGSLGQRAMVQSYAVLAWPLAASLSWILARPRWLMAYSVFFIVGVYYNLWLTHQAHRGGLLAAGDMNRAYWLRIIGRYNVPKEARLLLDSNGWYTGPTDNAKVLLEEGFEGQEGAACSGPPLAGRCSFMLDFEHQNTPDYSVPMKPGDYTWLRATVQAHSNEPQWDMWAMTLLTVRFYKADAVVKESFIRLERALEPGQTATLPLDVHTPRRGDYDRVVVKLWHPGKTHLLVDNLKLVGFPD